MAAHHFISYSSVDGRDFATRLYHALRAGSTPVPVWWDKCDLRPGRDYRWQIVEALKTCGSVLFVMSRDSVEEQSECQKELTRASRYKKPITPLLLHHDAEDPYDLDGVQHIDFTDAFDPALQKLLKHLQWQESPAGRLQHLKDCLHAAQRALPRATNPAAQARVQDDLTELKRQIAVLQRVVDDPSGSEGDVARRIAEDLEKECQTARPAGEPAAGRFVNAPPLVAPAYFQDRHAETKRIGDFLKDDALRLLTIVGRGGVGKTALTCRLLRSLEQGALPDGGGPLKGIGIVYLSGARRITFPHLFEDLARLLAPAVARELDRLYQDTHVTIETKMARLLGHFARGGRAVVLLDNFEDVVDPGGRALTDGTLAEALRALLNLPHHAVKVIVTTRVTPHDLGLVQPSRQMRLDLDEGLPSPYAENLLRALDPNGTLGLRDAPAELLAEARRRTRGYPRALEALVGILRADRDSSLPDLLAGTDSLMPENVVQDLVGEAFSRLDGTAQRVMQALAVYGRPVPPVAVNYLLQPYVPGGQGESVLARLVNMQFVRREGRRYHLHPVDQDYAYARIPDAEEGFGKLACHARAAEYYRRVEKPPEAWTCLADLEPRLRQFHHRVRARDYLGAYGLFGRGKEGRLQRWGGYELIVRLRTELVGKLGHPARESENHSELGNAYLWLEQVDAALKHCSQALVLAAALGDADHLGACLVSLGIAHRHVGEFASALEYYRQANTLAATVRQSLSPGALIGMGVVYLRLGEAGTAEQIYRAILDAARGQDRGLEGLCHSNLGVMYNQLGQFRQAVQAYRVALPLAQDHRSRSHRLKGLGYALHHLNQSAWAGRCYEAALALGISETHFQCAVLLGVVSLGAGKRDEARDYCRRGVQLCRGLLEKTPRLYEALYYLGLGQLALGPAAEALTAYRRALTACPAQGVVQAALRDLALLRRAAPQTPGLGQVAELLRHALPATAGGRKS